MSTPEFNNARATWDLLDEIERKALAHLAGPHGVITPDQLGRAMGVSWQRAARVARSLKEFGLVRIESRSKMTWYEISGQGKACLAASRPVNDLEAL